MKLFLRFFIIFILVFSSGFLKSQTLNEYIKKAEDFQKSYELDKAVNIMSEAVKKYPKRLLLIHIWVFILVCRQGLQKILWKQVKR